LLDLDPDTAGDQLGEQGTNVRAIVDRGRVRRQQAGVTGETPRRRVEVAGADQLG
jgi:hypothetical protein